MSLLVLLLFLESRVLDQAFEVVRVGPELVGEGEPFQQCEGLVLVLQGKLLQDLALEGRYLRRKLGRWSVYCLLLRGGAIAAFVESEL